MDNSIPALDSGAIDARALQGNGAGPASTEDSEAFGGVLDEQLQKGESQPLDDNMPSVAAPPSAEAQAAKPEQPLKKLTVGAVTVSGASQAPGGVAAPPGARVDAVIASVTGTPAETPQASSAAVGLSVSEVTPGSVMEVAHRVAGSVTSAGQPAVTIGSDAGNLPLPVAALIQQTSPQAAAVAATASARGAGSANDATRPQAELLAGAGSKFESSEQFLSSSPRITAIEAGQSLAEQRPGIQSPLIPAPPVSTMAPAAQAVAPAMQTAGNSSVLPLVLPALQNPLADGQWSSAFGQRVVWAVEQGVQSASLALNPKELGPVTVQIAVLDDEASLRFIATHVLTRDAIEAALPRLREMLQAGGLSLGQVDISGDAQARGGHSDTQQRGTGAAADPSRQGREETAVTTPVSHYTSRGLVDTFV